MKPIERSEVLPLGDYEAIRSTFRSRVVAEKKPRRVAVGEHMSVLFENRDTVLLQIQEMMRVERITRDAAIDHEIATYNDLVPSDDQLSMTLFIQIADKEKREAVLAECAGMEERVAIEVDGERYGAKAGDKAGADPNRTTAVQYYKVDLPPEVASRWRSGAIEQAAVVVDHPAYAHRGPMSPTTVAALGSDLAWT